MRVIAKSRLKEFWEKPGNQDAKAPLATWHKIVSDRMLDWKCFADVRSTFPTADLVDDCTVFNVGGNKYRLVTRIRYESHCVYTLKVMRHAEYDQSKWYVDCGCKTQPVTKVGRRPKMGRKSKASSVRQ